MKYTLIGRIDGSSSTRRQRKFDTQVKRDEARARWSDEGYNTFWLRDGDGELRLVQTRNGIVQTPEPKACTKCGNPTAHTEDWTLYPWPDGAWLCRPCNDARHEIEDYTDVEARERDKTR